MKQILPKIELLDPLLNLFRKCFTKPQFSNFCDYVSGLIALPKKSIRAISKASTRKKNQSSLNRFLTSSGWEEADVQGKYFSKIKNITGRDALSLIIDDSLSKKTGKHIEETQYHKDHSTKGYVFGHQIVTALLKTKDAVFPLFPKLYSKKTQSKIEFAKSLIELASSAFNLKEVIFDSWYTSKDIIKLCLQKKLGVIGCIKSNRVVSFEKGSWARLSNYYAKLKKKDFDAIVANDHAYLVHERVIRIKHVGLAKLLITKEWKEDEKKWSRPFYLISTNTKLSAVHIIQRYAQRWEIETFHRDLKQNVGLEAYQLRGRTGITRHLMLATLSYALLKLWMHFESVSWTIGEAIGQIQGKTFDDLIISIVEEKNVEERWRIAEPFISRSAKV
jgi:hypothetical protein